MQNKQIIICVIYPVPPAALTDFLHSQCMHLRLLVGVVSDAAMVDLCAAHPGARHV